MSNTPADGFFIDDDHHVWVRRTAAAGPGDIFDVYNATGQYMGAVTVPFALSLYPSPIIRAGRLVRIVTNSALREFLTKRPCSASIFGMRPAVRWNDSRPVNVVR